MKSHRLVVVLLISVLIFSGSSDDGATEDIQSINIKILNLCQETK